MKQKKYTIIIMFNLIIPIYRADAFAQKKQQQEDYKKKKIKIEELKDEVIEDPVGEVREEIESVDMREMGLELMLYCHCRCTIQIWRSRTEKLWES